MDGKLTINRITNCTDLTIRMDNATVIGDYSSLDINDIRNSDRTKITMSGMKVMTKDEYQRHKSGRSGGSYYGHGTGTGPGQLTVNRITDSRNTKIDQDKMKICGRFSDVKLNDITRSAGTDISMADVKVNGSSDSDSDDSDDEPRSQNNDRRSSDFDEDGLPKPSTYEYHIADKYTFSIRLGGGANVTCTFLREDRIRTVKKFIRELQSRLKDKDFRLQDVDHPEKYVDNYPEQTLTDAGIVDKMDLRVVITSPLNDG